MWLIAVIAIILVVFFFYKFGMQTQKEETLKSTTLLAPDIDKDTQFDFRKNIFNFGIEADVLIKGGNGYVISEKELVEIFSELYYYKHFKLEMKKKIAGLFFAASYDPKFEEILEKIAYKEEDIIDYESSDNGYYAKSVIAERLLTDMYHRSEIFMRSRDKNEVEKTDNEKLVEKYIQLSFEENPYSPKEIIELIETKFKP